MMHHARKNTFLSSLNHSSGLILWFLILVAITVGILYSLTRYYSLRAGLLDIGAYVHVLTAINREGVPLTTLTLLSGEQHWFGFHFSPIFYALAPFARVVDAHIVLNVISALVISMAALPIFYASLGLGLTRTASLMIAAAYLFNPFTLNASIWGFHETNLSSLWMAMALWAIITKRFPWLIAASALLLVTKEHYGASVSALGFLWWFHHRNRSGIYLSVAGLISLLVVMGFFMPFYRGDEAHPLLSAAMQNRYGWIVTPNQWAVVLPSLFLENLKYAALLFAGFLFLPIGGLIWLFAGVSDFGVNMLSNFNSTYRSPHIFYSVGLTPVLAIAAAQGLVYLKNFSMRQYLALPAVIFCSLHFLYFSLLPLPLSRDMFEIPAKPQLRLQQEHQAQLEAIKLRIDRQSKIAISDSVGYLLAEDYRYLSIFPSFDGSLDHIDHIVVHLEAPLKHSPSQIAPSGMIGLLEETRKLIENNTIWKITYVLDGWVVFSRGGSELKQDREKAIETFNELFFEQKKLYDSFYFAIDEVNREK